MDFRRWGSKMFSAMYRSHGDAILCSDGTVCDIGADGCWVDDKGDHLQNVAGWMLINDGWVLPHPMGD